LLNSFHLAQRTKTGLFYTRTNSIDLWVWEVELRPFLKFVRVLVDEVMLWHGEPIYKEYVDYFFEKKAAAKARGDKC
jgi:hypothetical protein